MRACMCACVQVCVCAHTCARVRARMCVCVCVCVCVYVCVFLCDGMGCREMGRGGNGMVGYGGVGMEGERGSHHQSPDKPVRIGRRGMRVGSLWAGGPITKMARGPTTKV